MDTSTKKNNKIDDLLQGVASLGSEPREGGSDARSSTDARSAARNLAEPRPKLSGAARRKLKRQRARERAEETSESGAASGGATGARGEADPPGTQKRPRPDLATPSPSEKRLDKRPKVSDQGSFAQATKGIVRVALIIEGYPENKIKLGEIATIKRLIRERILGLPRGTRAPLFTGVWERDGAIICGCADAESADWLKSLSSELKLGERELRVLPLEELPKRHRLVVHLEEPDLAVKEALELLDRQNAGLATSEWVVVRGSESRDAESAHFAVLVGSSSLRALKDCGMKPFCGMGRATVRLTGKERGREEEAAGAKEPA